MRLTLDRMAHVCAGKCELAGTCYIETQPSKIVEEFQGQHETFSYTKVCLVASVTSLLADVTFHVTVHAGRS